MAATQLEYEKLNTEISKVTGRRLWDSRGRPTVEAEITLADGSVGRAIAPAGASTGSGEALDLRDGGQRFGGYDVMNAVNNVNTRIHDQLTGMDVSDQASIDEKLVTLDGSSNRSNLGGNAMIAVSMAAAHAGAASAKQPLWHYLAEHGGAEGNCTLPTPEMQIFGGGAHAEGRLDLQDFMVVPYGASSFSEACEWVAEIYRAAGKIMDSSGRRMGVSDEGGYWPQFKDNEEAIVTLLQSITETGLDPHKQVGISLDIAATQIYRDNGYFLRAEGRTLNPEEWLTLLNRWLVDYPIVAIEDPFVENDLELHAELMRSVGDRLQVVGDDLLVTNLQNIAAAKEAKACNTLLCKPNQVGTLTEAKAAFEAAKANNWSTIVSARSGETEDITIVHLAMGWGISQLKVGSFARSERMAKWNEVIRIEEQLGSRATYAGKCWG